MDATEATVWLPISTETTLQLIGYLGGYLATLIRLKVQPIVWRELICRCNWSNSLVAYLNRNNLAIDRLFRRLFGHSNPSQSATDSLFIQQGTRPDDQPGAIRRDRQYLPGSTVPRGGLPGPGLPPAAGNGMDHLRMMVATPPMVIPAMDFPPNCMFSQFWYYRCI